MKSLKVIGVAIGLSLLLALNALAWMAVGEKYLTVQIQQAAAMNLAEQLHEAKVQNAMLKFHLQRLLEQSPPATGPQPGCPFPRPGSLKDA